jgi:CBS domain-containing protein
MDAAHHPTWGDVPIDGRSWEMQARDIMTTDVVTVRLDTPVPDVARLLVEQHISGVPVVDALKQVVGIVTEGDLLRRSELGTDKHRSHWLELFVSNVRLASEYLQAHGRTASEVMTRDVIQVAPDTAIATIVDIFEKNRIKRVPVIDKDKLVGIVSRGNLIQALGSVSHQVVPTSPDDRCIRDQVLTEFRRLPWGLDSESNVVVTDGVVHLWGLVSTPEEQAALYVSAEETPGVRRVEDHTILIRDDWHPRFRHRVSE